MAPNEGVGRRCAAETLACVDGTLMARKVWLGGADCRTSGVSEVRNWLLSVAQSS